MSHEYNEARRSFVTASKSSGVIDETLRYVADLRKKSLGVPPLCFSRPITLYSFSHPISRITIHIHGVGEGKAKKYGMNSLN
jgi:ATP-dependent DNA helicase RecQ